MYFIVLGGESVPTNKIGHSDGVALSQQTELSSCLTNSTHCLPCSGALKRPYSEYFCSEESIAGNKKSKNRKRYMTFLKFFVKNYIFIKLV